MPITIEQVKEHTREIESEVNDLYIGVSGTLSSNNLYPPAEDKVLEVKRLKTLDCKIQSLLNEVTTGEGGQILKNDDTLMKEVKGLRNHREYLSRKIQLFYPETLEELKQAIWWFLADPDDGERLFTIQDVKVKPPYNDQEIQNLFKKAETMLANISNRSKSLEQSPETMIAIAEIKDYAPDQPLQMGQSYYLQAGIKGKVPENSEEKASSSDGEKQGVQLQIVVWAEDMEIKPDWVQFYEFYEDRETSFIEFELEPNQLGQIGQKNIRVQFYYQRHWLGEVKFETQVIEAKRLVIA
jgi:hypothetical protein